MSDDRQDVIDVQVRYGAACDRRQWDLFDEVFTADAVGRWGGPDAPLVEGRPAIVAMVRAHLGGCGPSQHLLSNHQVQLQSDGAVASCAIRAVHVGRGDAAALTYESIGEYHDRLSRTPDGWRIVERTMMVALELGTRDVLGPG